MVLYNFLLEFQLLKNSVLREIKFHLKSSGSLGQLNLFSGLFLERDCTNESIIVGNEWDKR